MTTKLFNTLESGLVRRYHAAPTVAPQLLAHHQWNVAMLVVYLHGGAPSHDLLMEALCHDTDEFFTGDLPFTLKRDNQGIKAIVDVIGTAARDEKLLVKKQPLTEYETQLLKLADTLEGYMWCRRMEETNGPVLPRWLEALEVCRKKFPLQDAVWRRVDAILEANENQIRP